MAECRPVSIWKVGIRVHTQRRDLKGEGSFDRDFRKYVVGLKVTAYRHKNRFNNNSILSVQFFIVYVPSQQLQGQLQTQHSVDTTIIIIQFNSIQFFIINVPSQQQTPITETAQCVYNIT
jgi:hypothetical protein